MFKKRAKSQTGPSSPVVPQPSVPGDQCEIIFGHNADIKKVLMQFNVTCDRLIFTPENAEHVAAQLTYYAMLARGGKAS